MAGSLFGLLNIAQSGLAAQTAGLDATGQNVANVNTPGYSRVTANLETVDTPDGFTGGVAVAGMDRAFDSLTFGSLLTEQGLGGAADARSSALGQIESIVAPTTGSIGDNIDSFFASLQTLETSPSDTSARAGVIGAASQLAESISSTANELATQQTSLATEAQGVAATLNQNLASIAKLNVQIAAATGSGNRANRSRGPARPAREHGQHGDRRTGGHRRERGLHAPLLGHGARVERYGRHGLRLGGASKNLEVTSTLGDGVPEDITAGVTTGASAGSWKPRTWTSPVSRGSSTSSRTACRPR